MDVILPVPFIYLEGLDRCDGHDTRVIEEHIDAAETVDGPLYERFHFCALRHIGGKSDSLSAGGRDLLNHCADPVRMPPSHTSFCPSFAATLRVAFPRPP